MGIFDSSSATTNLSNELELLNNDNRIVEGGGSVGGNQTIGIGGDSENLYVTTTDFGALDAATEYVGRANSSIDNAVSAVQSMASNTGATLGSALNKVSDFATTQTGNDENKTVQYLIIAAGLIGIVYFFKK